jgi:hypothetical protein
MRLSIGSSRYWWGAVPRQLCALTSWLLCGSPVDTLLVQAYDAAGSGRSIAIRLIRIGEIKAAELLESSTRVVDPANV